MAQIPEKLLFPTNLGPLTLNNHIVMAPLTRSRAGQGDAPTDMNAEYYRQRAGAGLIIAEATQISPWAKGYIRTPGCYNEAQIAGWRKVTDAVHNAGGRIFLQMWHTGRMSHRLMQPDGQLPVAPSAIRPEGQQVFTAEGLKDIETPRELRLDEIPGIVNDFRQVAINAIEAGFDGVEIHAANGYLIDQFLRDGSNKRTDEYSGSVENRARFLKEIAEAVSTAIGAERVGVRVSPVSNVFTMSDSNPQKTFNYVAEMLNQFNLAYLHVVQLGQEPFDFTALKRLFNGSYIANGGFTADSAEAVLRDGKADLISFGQLFISNPDLVERFRQGAPLNKPDQNTFYQGEEKGYTDYPALDAV